MHPGANRAPPQLNNNLPVAVRVTAYRWRIGSNAAAVGGFKELRGVVSGGGSPKSTRKGACVQHADAGRCGIGMR